jgi:putative ABC transport system permease protein
MLADLRLAIRSLAARPAFTFLAVLALALGTGANTLVFSVVNGVLLQPLPFADADRLHVIEARGPAPEAGWEGPSGPDLRDIASSSSSFAAVGGIAFESYNLTGAARPQQLRGGLVTPGLLAAMGVPPLAGRLFTQEEIATGARVVLLDETVWRAQFNADPGVVGRPVTLNGAPSTVVGVLPHLRLGQYQEYEVWAPLSPKALAESKRGARGPTKVLARLRPGVEAAAAQRELDVIARRLAAQYPAESAGWTFRLQSMRAYDAGDLRPALLVLLGAVTLVLLIACTNVAHMLLARAAQREREIAVRTALGATRGRLVRQLLAESVALALAGSAAGVVLAYLLLPVLLRVAPISDAQRAAVAIDAPVLGVSLLVAAATGLLFGLWPALVTSRGNLQGVIKGASGHGATGRGTWRARGALVVSEVALASVLLVGAGLLLKSFAGILRVEHGYDPTLVATTSFDLPNDVYPEDADRREFLRRVIAELRATPGVVGVAAVNFLPSFAAMQGQVGVAGATDGAPAQSSESNWRVITPDYFTTLRIPLLRGRAFDDRDAAGATKVAIINQALAARYFAGQDPVGRDLTLATFGPPQTLRVVGVAGDVRNAGRTKGVNPDVFLPHAQNPWSYMTLVVRGSRTTPAALQATITRAVLAVDPARPTFSPMALADVAEGDASQPKFGATLMSLFAGVAALLACIGIFGVMAYAVAARTREIGIRIALGGPPRSVLAIVLRPGLALVAAGAAAGLLAALAAGRVLASQLHGVAPTDPAVIASTIALLSAVGAVACYLPARRATQVNPVIALQAE